MESLAELSINDGRSESFRSYAMVYVSSANSSFLSASYCCVVLNQNTFKFLLGLNIEKQRAPCTL